jgi:cell division septation protein DedD
MVLAMLALAAAPALAQRRKPAPAPVAAPVPPPTVRAGVDLWRAGDWAGAVKIWQPFAEAGDPDAMFNMGQAHKLGRAVPLDKALAREWYRKAAAKEHLPAQANLGILLFQAGEKPEAARWLKSAADRGEMRAQYVLGVAHWNGDGVPRSLSLAYAYLARASAQGLTEATAALNNLTRTIAPVERANGWAIATSLAAGKGVPANYAVAAPPPASPAPARAGTMTAAELNRQTLDAVQRPQTPPVTAAAPPPPPAVALPKPEAPPPAPVVAAAPVAAVASVAGTASATTPEVRKVDLPAASVAPPAPVVEPPKAIAAAPEKAPAPAKPAAKPRVAEAEAVGWRVQLGAFGKRAQAETAWSEIKAKHKAVVGTAKPIYAPGTSITKLQMGPYKTRTEAKDACAKLAFAGRACFVTES